MGLLFKKYKTKFRYALQPLFAMLAAKEKTMNLVEWQNYIQRTRESILGNPAEFLGPELPESTLMRDVLDEIFLDFHKDRKIKRKNS